MNDSNAQEQRPRGPRLYHKKSRAGCMRCKQRRVKCDELRPSCGSCSKHAVECVYPGASPVPSVATGRAASATRHNTSSEYSTPSTDQRMTSSSGLVAAVTDDTRYSSVNENKLAQLPHSSGFDSPWRSSHPVYGDVDLDSDLPEGPWRRVWELRLLHNYQTSMVQPFPVAQIPEIVRIWEYDIPNMSLRMAQEHNRCTLLYITFAHSALNLWTKSTDNKERDELIKLQQTYQIMCSKEQRQDIDELSQGISQNTDYICFSSLEILVHSIGLVQTLSADPWEPPIQWLHMGHGAGKVLDMAQGLIGPESNPKIKLFVNSPPSLHDPNELIFCDHSPLAWLLEHPAGPKSIAAQKDHELDDEEVRSVYNQALAYTCSVQSAIDHGEPDYAIVRRLGAFAIWVPIEFTRFVEERRPRAMVILAHFMALWLDYEHIWMIGRAGECQIRGIHKVLPIKWSYKLDGLFAKFKQQGKGR
ncbi:hypothetical protein AAE478_004639 [Parahypoxylon ruwenzoriense]